MNFDDYETLWRAQPAPAPAVSTAERAFVFDRVRQEARRFDRTIFWRDTREILVAFALSIHLGLDAWRNTGTESIAWGHWIAVALILGVAINLLIDRLRIPRPPAAEDSLLGQIDTALAGVQHQARVLRRVPTHYALPLALATMSAGLDSRLQREGAAAFWSPGGFVILAVSLLVGGFVIWLNRLALRRVLQPKIDELDKLRRELSNH